MAFDDQYTSRPPYNPYHPPRQPQRQSILLPVLTLLALVGLVVGGVFWFRHRWKEQAEWANPRPVDPRGELMPLEQSIIKIYETARPSVVYINTVGHQDGDFGHQEVVEGTGTGFIWDERGYIVTNYHVIRNADSAEVTLFNGHRYRASIRGYSPSHDLAVLSIRTDEPLRKILIGTSHDLKVGQLSFAIGNPFGLQQTLTMGVVSALGRQITSVANTPIKNVIQTSAAINPGNSGGPLLDSAARLIGVNTAIPNVSGANVGIGFAIPIDDVNDVVPQLIEKGKATRPGLGVLLASDQLAHQLKVKRGVLIVRVVPGGAAAKAGLRGTRQNEDGELILGDIIVSFNGHPINNAKDLHDLMTKQKVGNEITLGIIRDDQEMEVKVTLGDVG